MFDPLGILSLIQPTRIIQDLWKQKIDCDEQIPEDILQKWQKWKSTLNKVESIEIPRWHQYTSPSYITELHIFQTLLVLPKNKFHISTYQD